ncbi:glycoside hydrolase family 16 protein [Cladorrhinum sp. PSN259]|nr:glycoside hydrolase family 16 protein [Cladorrhinum sp. PSN259]
MGEQKAMEETKFASYSSVKESMDDPKLQVTPFTPPKRSVLAPKTWSRRTWLWLGSGVLLTAIVVGGAVGGVRATRKSDDSIGPKNGPYPKYSTLEYQIMEEYQPSEFLDKFEYFDGEDPANGFVQYTSQEEALRRNLAYVKTDNGHTTSVVLRADNSLDAENGRRSIRLHSKNQYGPGLFIFDVKHTPYGCGSQPALWLADPDNWPENGEIGVMRGYHGDHINWMNLYTSANCNVGGVKRKMKGSQITTHCDYSSESFNGCFSQAWSFKQKENTYTIGPNFNNAGGGIMAMEYRNEGIRIWQFSRDNIPDDISLVGDGHQKNPNPSKWGPPMADYPNTNCNIGDHFKNQRIIVNIGFCGSPAPYRWTEGDGCFVQNPGTTCQGYVAQNASAFDNTYWEFNGFQIYRAASY